MYQIQEMSQKEVVANSEHFSFEQNLSSEYGDQVSFQAQDFAKQEPKDALESDSKDEYTPECEPKQEPLEMPGFYDQQYYFDPSYLVKQELEPPELKTEEPEVKIFEGKGSDKVKLFPKKKVVKRGGAPPKCSYCHKEFSTITKARHHEKVIHTKELTAHCEFCGAEFNERLKVELHQLRRHKELLEKKRGITIPVHQCDKCEKTYNFKPDLDRHWKDTHAPKVVKVKEPEVHPCSLCGKVFGSRYLMKAHEKRHENAFTCDSCGSTYKKLRTLQDHIAAVHRAERNYKCDECGKTFTWPNVLKTHKKLHNAVVKPFHCIYCESAYGEKRNLLNHIGRNHPEQPIKFRKLTEGGEFEIVEC